MAWRTGGIQLSSDAQVEFICAETVSSYLDKAAIKMGSTHNLKADLTGLTFNLAQ
jgi:hypothetical protein